MNNTILQLLILAGVALFLIFRLKNVLGTRDGFEPKGKDVDSTKIEERKNTEDSSDNNLDEEATEYLFDDKNSANALTKIKEIEKNFSLTDFLGGAGSAYEMILMAFQSGKISPVETFLSADVKENFEEAVQEREQKGLSIDADFIGLRDTAVKNISFRDGVAEISVSFLADVKSVVKNNNGEIIEGEEADTKKQFDVWVFSREIGSDNPNWILVETGA
ncbi:MAG: Tim44/TimA family putative adaptor protein [Paracoccaceae bacterium]|nr:Tim44/TimA family putative adaptor protein [Paracoccaceae bacterium]